jgi:hypothetical protein
VFCLRPLFDVVARWEPRALLQQSDARLSADIIAHHLQGSVRQRCELVVGQRWRTALAYSAGVQRWRTDNAHRSFEYSEARNAQREAIVDHMVTVWFNHDLGH